MLYLLIFSLIVVIIMFFLLKKNIEQKTANKKLEKEKQTLPIKDKNISVKKEVFYKLNVSPIKLYIYPVSSFSNFYLNNLYTNIIVKKYLLEEPFHTVFARFLFYAAQNEFWILSQESNFVVSNIRDKNGIERKLISFLVLDFNEVFHHTLIELIDKNTLTLNEKKSMTFKVFFYILSKTCTLKLYDKNEDNYLKLLTQHQHIISLFSAVYSAKEVSAFLSISDSELKIIECSFNEIIDRVYEYPNYIQEDEITLIKPKILEAHSKKVLRSIGAINKV